ncbi:hypothetical protein M3I53_31515 [Paraburkholderia sp. CNPSo 3272]|uniref:hypothetical protein n=1 Tax=Paraburkholderia sp. CNPSo 3272 TaxID=2940931 RepID=UPI0020B8605D|nr:hypothetical protein [Paraburkholderia sp. CNPSo 3272]MCP3727597.1 hypothetical protein [Paraburkholderia sp. CNPSo 3272]
MAGSQLKGGALEREFDLALELLEARSAVLERVIRRYSADSPQASEARKAYDLARVVLLSCELRLRSQGIARQLMRRRLVTVVVFSNSDLFRKSLTVLLRAEGYHASAVSTLQELAHAVENQQPAAVVIYPEPMAWRAPLFVEEVASVAPLVPILMLVCGRPASITGPSPCSGIHNIDSVHELVATLDKVTASGQIAESLQS